MSTITTRADKGSPLTNAELDANFSNLNNGKLETSEVVTTATANKLLKLDSNAALPASITGNAATATTLQTARTIGGVSFDGSANINLPGVNAAGNQNTTGSSYSIVCLDTRAVAITPQSLSAGMKADFKTNTTDGLADGGTYHGVLSFRQYSTGSDTSGGLVHQLGLTDNGNLWQRTGSGGTNVWGSWKKVLNDANYTSYAPTLTGTGASGTWGISVTGSSASCTGNAATATNANQLDGYDSTEFARERWDSVVVGGDANTYYPVVWNNGSEDWSLFLRKHVHDYASWDGTLTAEINWHSTTWGGDAGYAQLRRLYQNQSNKFLANWSQSGGPNSYAIVWLRGGGRTYQWRTSRWIGNPTVYLSATDLGNSNGTVSPTTTLTTTAQHSPITTYNAASELVGGNTFIHSGNYTSYAPSLTGTGASGTWGISVSGNAATATTATNWSAMPSGTKLMFAQAAAPTGWTQIVTDDADNRMLRVVKTAGAGLGGSHSPILNNVVPSHTHGFTTGTESADHSHSGNTGTVSADHTHRVGVYMDDDNYDNGLVGVVNGDNHFYDWYTGGITANHYHGFGTGGRSAAHTHSGTTDNGSSQTNWTPRYIDMILCSKN